tara:strand:- start:70222 stop:70899 length:678 start_codon:yes stop_codon:yes gene_type:complete
VTDFKRFLIMAKPLVKYCGMKRAEDIAYAVELGVDYIGVILVAETPRGITLEHAAKLRQIIPSHVKMVTVVRNADASFIQSLIAQVKPDYIQFHGDETPEFCAQFKYPFWKAIAVKNKQETAAVAAEFYAASALVFDAWSDQGSGGHGVQFDWSFMPEKKENNTQLIGLAGGLTAGNVQDALPLFEQGIIDFIDVSSGTEARGAAQVKGEKSKEQMSLFMRNLRG